METIKCCCCDKIYDERNPSTFKEKNSGKFKGFYHITEATMGDYKELHSNLAHNFHIGDISCRKCTYKVRNYINSKAKKQDHAVLDDEVNLSKIPKYTHQIEENMLQKEERGHYEGIYFLLISEITEKEQNVASRYEDVVKKLGIDKLMEIFDNIDPSGVVSRIIFLNYLRTLKGTQV
jgi:hypothetical protein